MRILVLDAKVPFPPLTGGQSRTFHLLKSLAAEHELTMVAFRHEDVPINCPYPAEVVCVPYVLPERHRLMYEGSPAESEAAYAELARADGEPWFVSYYDSPAMDEILDEMRSRAFDLILIEHSFMARYRHKLPRDVPSILDLHNVHTLMAWRAGGQDGSALPEYERTRAFERLAVSECQLCLCCSEREEEAARSFLNAQSIEVIPNGVDTTVMVPQDGPETAGYLLFTGMMNYAPNVAAVRYFVQEVLPLIRAVAPEVTFHIAGADPTEEVKELTSDSVFVHGYAADLRPYFHESSVVVVPLLHGGGTRLKILDAAACGKPIVSTSLGAEGLNFVDGRDIVLADGAGGFAQKVVALLSDATRRHKLSRHARQAALEYDWAKIGCRLREVVRNVV